VARRSENTHNLEFVMHRTPPSFLSARIVAGWVVAFVLMAVAGTASAQVTAVTAGTSCQNPVLQSPSTTNPLRLQAGTVSFELWGTTSLTATNAGSLFQLPGLQSVEVLAVRTATQNSSRGCPAVPSVSIQVRTDGLNRDTVNGSLTVPYGKSSRQTIGLRVVPYPTVGWVWLKTPIGSVQSSCTVPTFDFQYTSNSVLSLKIPFNATLGLECKQKIASMLVAGPVDAHIKGPIPVRLTTQLTGLPSADLPVPIAPESMPTQVDLPGKVKSVPIMLSKNGVLRRQRDFPLEVATPNGSTSRLTASMVAITQDPAYSITITGWFNPPDRTGLVGETTPPNGIIGVFPSVPFDVLFKVDPAVREFSLPITWRLSNSACFTRYDRAGSASFNPGGTFQSHNLAQGQSFFEVVLIPSTTAACVPAPGQFRDETLEVWAGTDTSRPPAARTTVRVLNP
jgi:hypothetical protein